MTSVQDLTISFDELEKLVTYVENFMTAINYQKSTGEITNCLNRYELILENESISEAVKILQKCFNVENEQHHEKYRLQVRENMKPKISQNDAQKLDAIIERAKTWFEREASIYSTIDSTCQFHGYAGFYLWNCWNPKDQRRYFNRDQTSVQN